MLKMRLQRIGRKNEPHFRVVITDARNAPKSGKFLEIVGSYNPKSGSISFEADRVKEWIAKGVQVSETIHNFLIDHNLMTGKKKNVLPKKTAPKKEAPVVSEASPVETVSPEAPEESVPQADETGTAENVETDSGTEDIATPEGEAQAEETPGEAVPE